MKAALDFETQLHAVPVQNEKLRVCDSPPDSDSLVVEVELRYRGVLGGIANFVKARRRKRYELAGVSRELFDRLDGKRTVEDLVDWFCEQDRLNFLEGRALVLHYLRDLMKRGLVVVVTDEAGAGGS